MKKFSNKSSFLSGDELEVKVTRKIFQDLQNSNKNVMYNKEYNPILYVFKLKVFGKLVEIHICFFILNMFVIPTIE